MGYQEISIGALERGVRTLAKSLEKDGLKSVVRAQRNGRGSQDVGPSYVELEVTAVFDKDGKERTSTAEVKFLAGGYETSSRYEISSTDGWRAMAAEGRERIYKQLESDGWKRPAHHWKP